MFKISSLDHLVLNVTDAESSLTFYEGLGLPAERADAYRAGTVPFPSVRINDTTIIDLFPPSLHHAKIDGNNVNHFCFVVDADTDGLREKLIALGMHIAHEDPNNFGARGYGASFYVRDPDGNTIELKSYGGG